MTPQTHQAKEVGEPSAAESQQTELSLEPNAEHEPWEPDTRVKRALGAQAFCVVSAKRWLLLGHGADLIEQFIISLDMTILTATLPVCTC